MLEINEILTNIDKYDEFEIIEFKENAFDPEYIGETISSISNSVSYKSKCFGYIIYGISNDKKLVGTNINLSKKKVGNEPFESWLHHNLFPNINFEFIKYEFNGLKFEIIKIPSSINNVVKFKGKSYKGKGNGVGYIRIGQTKQVIDNYPEIIKSILNSGIDWSGLPCEGSQLSDLDNNAIDYLRKKLFESKKDKKWLNKPIIEILNHIGLLSNNIPNNTCILFLGKTHISNKFIKERNLISWKYYDEKNGIEERLNIDDQKAPLLLTLEKIKSNINRFNTFLKDIDLFRTDIRQYDEKAIEELIINGLVHRDWTINLWNEIVQTPISLEFRNPGNFRPDLEKIIQENISFEYLNPTMANFLQHINLMEKERGGLRKVYKAQLSKGVTIKFKSNFNRVDFVMSGIIENEDFAKLVLKNQDIKLDDLFVLDKIANGKNIINIDLNKDTANSLKSNGYIEIRGTKTQKCYISANFSQYIRKKGNYIRKKGVKTKQKYELILEHIEEFGKIKLENLKDMFLELSIDQRKNLFRYMKNNKIIKLVQEGARRDWYYIKNTQ